MSLWIRVGGPSVSVAGGIAHATDFPAYPPRSKRRTVETVCGKKRARLLGIDVVNKHGEKQGGVAMYWPPFVADLKEQALTRCGDCMTARPGRPSRPEGPLVGSGGPR